MPRSHPTPRHPARRSDGGVALIMVVLVLAALVIIGTPFVLSMRSHEMSSRQVEAAVKARLLAEAAANHAIRMSMDNHEYVERQVGGSASRDQDYDLFSEFQMVIQDLEQEGKRGVVRWRDPRGSLLEAKVYDEQGKIHLNSAPGTTLGSLLGATELAKDLELEDKEMEVLSTAEFFSDGDPDTLDGYLRVGTELIGYRHATGTKFTGLMRGFLLSAPTPESRLHPEGAIVRDGRGQKIALHKMWSEIGRETAFETVNSVRRIADWTLLRYVEEKLVTWGITLEDLEEYGIDPAGDLAEIGINAARLERPELEKSEEQKEAEKALKEAGLDPELLGRMGGTDRLERTARWIQQIPENFRERALRRVKERQKEMEAFLKEVKAYHGDYVPEAVKDILFFLTRAADIETIPPSELEEIREFVTTSSYRSREWTDEQYNLNRVSYNADLRSNFNTAVVNLPLTDSMGIGSLIRIVDGGGGVHYRVGVDPEELLTERFSRFIRRRRGQVAIWPQLTGIHEPGELRVQGQIQHPVNLNTADRRVIRALLLGLRGRPTVFPPAEGAGEDFVSLAEAEALAELILETPLRDHDDLVDLLDEVVEAEIISDQDAGVILKNALNPNDPTLYVSSLPFCYRSYDVYTVEATAIVNSESGMEQARHGIRQIVEVAPPEILEWTEDSQRDFTTEIRTVPPTGDPNEDMGGAFVRAERFNPDGNRVTHLLDRRSNKMVSFPDPIYNSAWVFGNPSHEDTVGEMRLETGVSDDSGASGPQFIVNMQSGGGGPRMGQFQMGFGGTRLYYEQHFWQTTDGMRIDDQGVRAAAFGDRDRGLPRDDQKSQEAHFADYATELVGPGYISMWIRPEQTAGIHYLLDVADEPALNRVEFLLENGEIVFRIADAARDAAEGSAMGQSMGRRHAEIRAPITLRPDTWYHLAASVKGPKPGEQSIFLDGRSIGHPMYTTRLTGRLGEYAVPSGNDPYLFEDVFVEDSSLTAGFPEEGTIIIGDEAMEYFRKDAGSFRVRVRRYYNAQTGGRDDRRALPGSTPQDHEDGAVVTVFGYTNYSKYDMPRGAVGRDFGTLGVALSSQTLRFKVKEFLPASSSQTPTGMIVKAQITLDTAGSFGIQNMPDYGYITVRKTQSTQITPGGGGTGGTPGGGGRPGGGDRPRRGGRPGGGRGDGGRRLPGGGNGAGILQTQPQVPTRVDEELMFFRRSGDTLECWRNAEGWWNPQMLPQIEEGDWVYLSSIQLSAGGPDVTQYFPNGVHEGYVQLWLLDRTQMQQQNPLNVDSFPLPPCEWVYVERPGGGPNSAYLSEVATKGIDYTRIFIVPRGGRKSPYTAPPVAGRNFLRQSGSRGRGPGARGRRRYNHSIGTPVHPVYEMHRSDMGQIDHVTIYDNQTPAAERVEKQVVMKDTDWEHYADRDWRQPGYLTGKSWSYASFAEPGWYNPGSPAPDPLPREYVVAAGARVAKWPSDELPMTRPRQSVSFCEIYDGGDLMEGTVDEILVRPADGRIRPEERVALQGNISSMETDLFLSAPNANNVVTLLRDGGAIKIEDEVIGVAQASDQGGGQILCTGCVRGFLGTVPEMHASGITATIQSFPGVTLFDRLEDDRLIVRSANAFPQEGYIAWDRGPSVDLDIWAYKRTSGRNRITLCEDVRGRATFLGGMFGTRPTNPGPGDLLVAMPFRYFDRYAPGIDSPDAACFEVSRRIPGAIWRSLRWDGTTPPGTEIRILARVDGKPDWTAEPNKPVGGYTLHLFNDPEAENRIDQMGDQIEVRVHFTYKDGAFKRDLGAQSDEWKDTPVLRAFTVEYHRPVRVLHREELVF